MLAAFLPEGHKNTARNREKIKLRFILRKTQAPTFECIIGFMFRTLIILTAALLTGCTTDRELDFTARPDASGYALLYYWDFNNTDTEEALITPQSEFESARIEFEGNFFDDTSDGSEINLRQSSEPGSALRLRNPSRHLDITFSTVGFGDVLITYALMRTNNGAKRQRYAVSTDGGNNFIEAPVSDLVTEVLTEWHAVEIDLSSHLSANDNPEVILRVIMEEGNIGDSGNHRIDNLSIEAKPLD